MRIGVTDLGGARHEVQANAGDRLMEVLREYDWGVAAICGGMCSCATCHVFLEQDWFDRFPEADYDEQDLLDFLDHRAPNSRLSCQLTLEPEHDGLQVTLAPEE
ncbi:MAG: 2Fe-2S iron-sulfur cluster binding domain-containing protein [Xanthomonadales bacterium]|nr:2Fe-2S iron-sulfur cluster binding domain-containing protein [Xanthomonadales bacterium]NIN60043.1 2Fe-2S iron-sulfur cluster binding domain-containing protein [Xanthomonadales bacterium]NIN75411.1 2Fe-2S iron-sulfur cluster binding domain-containing protein [Xanthomonadales bacterium]NIO14234.1 2Fe-2S iron-sulfur cluster binding domain-containing protein [Xanthomonadales bacterium]NIP12436.1 2Fe-2S iron-sulfur cluster binding domain-containing protein [Xanthomonadales bacterium]